MKTVLSTPLVSLGQCDSIAKTIYSEVCFYFDRIAWKLDYFCKIVKDSRVQTTPSNCQQKKVLIWLILKNCETKIWILVSCSLDVVNRWCKRGFTEASIDPSHLKCSPVKAQLCISIAASLYLMNSAGFTECLWEDPHYMSWLCCVS